jgi:hypothetical protein
VAAIGCPHSGRKGPGGRRDPSIVYVESAAGGLFLEEDAEIRRYILMFEHLRAAASGLDATAALLKAIVSEI